MVQEARAGPDEEEDPLRIWIDADACPRAIQEIVFRAAVRLGVPVLLVANRDIRPHRSSLIGSVRVGNGFDAADAHIAHNAAAGDLVITADIPLAARVVAEGAYALDPRGDSFTEDNVGGRLALRDLMEELRSGGLVGGGPAPLGRGDRERFANALDRLLNASRRP